MDPHQHKIDLFRRYSACNKQELAGTLENSTANMRKSSQKDVISQRNIFFLLKKYTPGLNNVKKLILVGKIPNLYR